MVKQLFNDKKFNSGVTREAPFSRFYRDYFFISLHALEQMYYGVSEKSVYVGFSSIFNSLLGKDFSLRGYNQQNFRPIPDLYLPQNEFRAYLRPIIEGDAPFLGFRPNTFAFNFVTGLYLYLIWKLGGGNRVTPLHDPTRLSQFYGFYDLEFTPLAVCFKFYIKISFFFNKLSGTSRFSEYYLFNQRSLSQGYAAGGLFFSRKCEINIRNFLDYLLFPLFFFIFEIIGSFFFNVFLRTFFYRTVMRRARIQNFRIYDKLYQDYFWLDKYAKYLTGVLAFYKLSEPTLSFQKSIRQLRNYRFISAYYASLYDSHMLYRTRRYNRYIYSIYLYADLLFAPKYSIRFFHFLELQKFAKFKRLVLLGTENSYFSDVSRSFFTRFTVTFAKVRPSEYLQLFKSKFLFFGFPTYLTEFSDLQKWTVGELKKKKFGYQKWAFSIKKSYKNLENTKFNFQRSGELNRLRVFLFENVSVFRVFFQFFEAFLNFFSQVIFAVFFVLFYRQFKRISQFLNVKIGFTSFALHSCIYKLSLFYVPNTFVFNLFYTLFKLFISIKAQAFRFFFSCLWFYV